MSEFPSSRTGQIGKGVGCVDGPSGNCQTGMLTRVAKEGPTLSTECRSQLGREGREAGFGAREEMSVVRSIHMNYDGNGAF